MALVTLGLLTICFGWAVYYFWPAIESEHAEARRFEEYRSGTDPLLRDLAAGKIMAGDPVENLIKDYSLEIWSVRHDEYVTIWHIPKNKGIVRLRLLSKDGRLFYAGFEWEKLTNDRLLAGTDIFFQECGVEQLRACEESFERFMRHLRESRRAREMAALAVAGFGATIDPKARSQKSDPAGK